MKSTSILMTTAILLSTVLCSIGATCPPKGFDSVSPFDIQSYIKRSWFVQEQMPVVYQRRDSLFCVVATYELQNAKKPSEGLFVFNYANRGKVNGEATGESGIGSLQAQIPDADDPSKLLVGPEVVERFLGQFSEQFYGDYWVVAVGPISDPSIGYDWAIVSGGPPRIDTGKGCRTGRRFLPGLQVNDIGLWLFSRKRVDPEGTKKMRKVAKDLGFDISVLVPVEQKGCRYEGARLK